MHSTQLACPRCGSTLTFGTQIAAGTPVECMICMQTFAAEPVAIETKAPVPTPSLATAVTEKTSLMGKPVHPKPARQSAPSFRRSKPAPTGSGKGALLAIALGLFLVLAGGVGIAAWKLIPTADTGPGPIAQQPNAEPQIKESEQKVATISVNPPPPAKKDTPSQIEDDDDVTRKIKAAEKKQLVRKTPTQSGGGLEWTPIIINNNQEPADPKQRKINDAIDKALAYLKKTQNPKGTWGNNIYEVGHASLGGLTLLECRTPADDLQVQRSAQFVRANAHRTIGTYEVSLAVLFLDRLGDPRDRSLIQGMALRLLTAQQDCGGWGYQCRELSPQEMYQLLTFLKSHKQLGVLNSPKGVAVNPAPIPAAQGKADPNDSLRAFQDLIQAKGLESENDPQDLLPPPKEPSEPKKGGGKANPPKRMALRPDWLTFELQQLPVVKNQGKGKGQQMLRAGNGDNSNTQFALLALWAARRHGVPSDQALLAAFQRFVRSQDKSGGWGYTIAPGDTTDTMTCVGLLGLALGHGAAPEFVKFDPDNPNNSIVKPALMDPRIQRGLFALGRHLGNPQPEGRRIDVGQQNLYFLWSVERVAMLYDLKAINGKDWYGWGAQNLVHRQTANGSWVDDGFPGAAPPLNTCFALLFLKRSNLVQDLTNNLRLYTGIRDPEK